MGRVDRPEVGDLVTARGKSPGKGPRKPEAPPLPPDGPPGLVRFPEDWATAPLLWEGSGLARLQSARVHGTIVHKPEVDRWVVELETISREFGQTWGTVRADGFRDHVEAQYWMRALALTLDTLAQK